MSAEYDVVIIGGGISGMALAVALSNHGINKVKLLEKAGELRPLGAAIGLFPNGLAALKACSRNVHAKVIDSAIDTKVHVLLDLDGNVVRERERQAKSEVKLLVWYLLQQFLFEEIAETRIVSLNSLFTGATQDEEGVVVHFEQDEDLRSIRCRVLVCADGVWSSGRKLLGVESKLNYHGKVMYRSVLPLSMLDGGTCAPAGVQKAWCGTEAGKLFVIRETAKGLATVTAMARQVESDGNRKQGEELREHMYQVFKHYPQPVQHIIERMDASTIFAHEVWDIDVCSRWSKGNVVCIGDSVHSMTPGLGQGANLSLEDAIELSTALVNVLKPSGGLIEISNVLTQFWKDRIERVKEIHARSRLRTERSKTSTVSSRSGPPTGDTSELDDFRERIFGWRPSSFEQQLT